MPSENSGSSSGGCGLTAVGLTFVALKLSGHIDWTWFWVLSPWWISFAVWLGQSAVLIIAKAVLTRRARGVRFGTAHRTRPGYNEAERAFRRQKADGYSRYTSLQDLKEDITAADQVRDEEER